LIFVAWADTQKSQSAGLQHKPMDEIVDGFAQESVPVKLASEQIATINAQTATGSDVVGGLGLVEAFQSAADGV